MGDTNTRHIVPAEYHQAQVDHVRIDDCPSTPLKLDRKTCEDFVALSSTVSETITITKAEYDYLRKSHNDYALLSTYLKSKKYPDEHTLNSLFGIKYISEDD